MSYWGSVYVVCSYGPSSSAYQLNKALGAKRIKRHNQTKFLTKEDCSAIINWGCSSGLPAHDRNVVVINRPENVRNCSNKLSFFNLCSQNESVVIPDYTADKRTCAKWLSEGYLCFARTKLNSNSGRGIIQVSRVESLDEIPDGTLITKYIDKDEEYRVHYGVNGVISVQKKGKKRGFERTEEQGRVRSHDNGFVFMRQNIAPPKEVITQAKNAFMASGLDFGAFDVIYTKNDDRAYVLETNTAPGLVNSTIEDYKNFFKGLVT